MFFFAPQQREHHLKDLWSIGFVTNLHETTTKYVKRRARHAARGLVGHQDGGRTLNGEPTRKSAAQFAQFAQFLRPSDS